MGMADMRIPREGGLSYKGCKTSILLIFVKCTGLDFSNRTVKIGLRSLCWQLQIGDETAESFVEGMSLLISLVGMTLLVCPLERIRHG